MVGFGDAKTIRLCRRMTNHDPKVARRIGVDVVDAGRIFRHHPQALAGLKQGTVERREAAR